MAGCGGSERAGCYRLGLMVRVYRRRQRWHTEYARRRRSR